jgi:hypothetical protein
MITRIISLAFVMLIPSAQLLAKEWYSAPNATVDGDGSLQRHWPLRVALQKNTVLQPGDTLSLRGGSYRGPGFVSNLMGASNNYVTVRSYPGEWAIVTDGIVGTLLVDINSTTNHAVFGGADNWSAGQTIFMGTELMQLDTIPGTPVNWRINRAWGGTAAMRHSAGTTAIYAGDFIQHNGSYVMFRDFEITAGAGINRIVGTSNYLGSGLNLPSTGHGNKAVNLIVHNVGHPGIGFWQQGEGGEINGCLIWGVGMYDSNGSWTRGSAIYSQNSSGGMATIKNIISFRNFTSGGKVYGETGPVLNFQFLSNIVFQCSPTLEGSSGSTSTSNLWWNGNIMMGTPSIAYVSLSNRFEYFINNTIVSGSFTTSEHNDSVYTNNLVFMTKGAGNSGSVIGYSSSHYQKSFLNNVWDYNTYYLGDGSTPYNFDFATADVNSVNSLGGGTLRFFDGTKGWPNGSGYDTHSTYQEGWPNNYLKVSVQQSDYDSNRWHIAVVSTSGQTNTSVPLSNYGFTNGDKYQLLDIQNWPVVVSSGTYRYGAINLPLNLTNVSPTPGVTHFANEHTNVRNPGLFNAFIRQRLPTLQPPADLRRNAP